MGQNRVKMGSKIDENWTFLRIYMTYTGEYAQVQRSKPEITEKPQLFQSS